MSSFAGYLIKFVKTGEILPNTYIKNNSYKVEPSQRLDLDSTRDTTGYLHRTVLQHTATRIDLSIVACNIKAKEDFMDMLHDAMDNVQSKTIRLQYWNDEFARYDTGTFYIPDIAFQIYSVDEVNNDITYAERKLAFVEY